MLERLYIDNYKCLVNFEFQAGPLQLLLGVNGTGKSTVFGVLSLVRDFLVEGSTTTSLFSTSSLTRWQSRDTQTFELDMAGNGGQYQYHLEIEQDIHREQSRIKLEKLSFNAQPLFSASYGKGRLYRDDFSEGPEATFDWTRSGVAALAQRPDNQLLTRFKERMSRVYCLRLNPWRMAARTESEEPHPNSDLSNFSSWYRHLMQEKPTAIGELHRSLAELFEGFEDLKPEHEGHTVRVLRLSQKSKGESKPLSFDFDELSDGQRVLIALYTLLHCSTDGQITLCIDEPDNFVSLREIQPWVSDLCDKAEMGQCQVLLASHHPELINHLARDCGVLFGRIRNGPVRVRKFPHDSKSGLQNAEVLARGWEDE